MPWTAWLLLAGALAPGLTLALLFLRAHTGRPRDRAPDADRDPDTDAARPPW